jgi:hypothetical protein
MAVLHILKAIRWHLNPVERYRHILQRHYQQNQYYIKSLRPALDIEGHSREMQDEETPK